MPKVSKSPVATNADSWGSLCLNGYFMCASGDPGERGPRGNTGELSYL